MKPYFYDMMIAIGITNPKWMQVVEEERQRIPNLLQSAKVLRGALTRLNEEYPAMKAPVHDQSNLLALMRAHYERYDWMVKQGCFFLSPEEPGYPDIMIRMDKKTGSRKGHFYPGVIYCKGDKQLLSKPLHLLCSCNQPHGFGVKPAITAIVQALREASCHPIIPLSSLSAWDIIAACLKANHAPIVILDKGIDHYLKSGEPTEVSQIDQVLRGGGLIMTNRMVGDNKPIVFPNQYRFYFMFALSTRMHMLQANPNDNSRFLIEAALLNSVRISLLKQDIMPQPLPEYYKQLPPSVQVLPLKEWVRL